MTQPASPAWTSEITAAQVRAARALLAWSQRDLASKAQVATSTVADFERGYRVPVQNSLDAIREALEAAGVTLASGGATAGSISLQAPGAKLVPGSPLRWVTATDLVQWGGTRVGQDIMPELISRLIRASAGSAADLHFPAQDSVQFPGWDGQCELETGTEHIPSGRSVWEVGTQRERIAAKADGDYRKRTGATDPGERARTTFVFVTPQRWPGKSKWLKEKRADGKWLDVRAYDADSLVHWIEMHPVVGHWLASLIGRRPPGLRRLDEAWREWSLSTEPPISAELVLAGRDEEEARILYWLRGAPGLLSVQADSIDEAIAFLHAATSRLPPGHREAYLSRAFVASAEQARALRDSMSPLVLVLDHPDPGLAKSLAQRHHVYVPYGSDLGSARDTLPLARPFRYDIEAALAGMGLDRAEAHKLARDSGRSATIIRRLMPVAPGVPIPSWATRENAGAILPALLAGAWDGQRPGDREVLQRLGKGSYPEVEARLSAWTAGPDSPLWKVGETWKVASPRDAWLRLAPFLPPSDFQAFTETAAEVLKRPDPSFDIPEADRWLASVRGVEPEHSSLLKAGMAEMLALIAVQGDRAVNVPRAAERAEGAVRTVLEHADRRRWWSLVPYLRTLAEAAPAAFLDALQESFRASDPPVMALFGQDTDAFAGARHSDLLWALECLAWSEDHLPEVARILAKLDRLDPGGRYSNRPLNSLRHIFLLWLPQTTAPLDVRLRVLDRLRREEPETAWRLLLRLVPQSHDVSDPSPFPRWRDFASKAPAQVTYADWSTGAEAIVGWLLDGVGADVAWWKQVLDLLPRFSPDQRGRAINQLESVVLTMREEADRSDLRKQLRHLVHHHREFHDADWAMPPEQVDEFERIHDLLNPSDPVEGTAWLFENHWGMELLRPNDRHEWQANRDEAEARRRQAVEVLITEEGPGVIGRLAQRVAQPFLVGIAVAQSACSDHDKRAVLLDALRSDDDVAVGLAGGLIGASYYRNGEGWVDALLALAPGEGWTPQTLVRILLALPADQKTWKRAAAFGGDVETTYWKRVRPFPQDLDAGSIAFVVGKLLDAGRARTAVNFVAHALDRVANPLLVEMLKAAAANPLSEDHSDDAAVLHYNVERILQHLDGTGDVPTADLARLEWTYLPLLEHSPRGLRSLHEALSREPAFFVQVLSLLYWPDPESGVEPEPVGDPESVRAHGSRAFQLLQSWGRVPGTEGTHVDAVTLRAWVQEARQLCDRAGRLAVGDQQIGRMLARAPVGEDGIWPAVAVRDVVEAIQSGHLETGVEMGLLDKGGGTIRGAYDGGDLERGEAAVYRSASRGLKLEWPRTSALLMRVARSYESFGRSMDADVERRDWTG
jgi:transcriptional regulator with XRE-family HTH domain